jgi:hypothetical protein
VCPVYRKSESKTKISANEYMRGVTGIGKKEEQTCEKGTREQARKRAKGGRGRETDMPVGQAPLAGPAGGVLLGYSRLDDTTVSCCSLIPACLYTCKHSLHNTKGQRIRGPGDRPGPATEMSSDARAHTSEKPALAVGDNNQRIVV